MKKTLRLLLIGCALATAGAAHAACTNCGQVTEVREIKVEVTRPGVSVRARSGYYADPPGDSLLLPDQRALFATARAGKRPASLPVAVEADAFYRGPDAPVAVVTVEVPTDSLRFSESTASNMEDSLQILGLITDSTGLPVTTFGRPLPLQQV